MYSVEIKKVSAGLFRKKLSCNSNFEDEMPLEFSYKKLDKLQIFQEKNTVIETDGGTYLNYLSERQIFVRNKSEFPRSVLLYGEDEIDFKWIHRIGGPLVSFTIHPVEVLTKYGDCNLIFDARSGRYSRLETKHRMNFLFAVGILAFCWTMEEHSSHITA